ncbi:MAG: elongation factor Tu [Candidatus Methanoperedens sp.]|nr:elongation factor Tu [Candidatus Methanoperedens sp.]
MANVAIIGSEKSGRTSLAGKLGKKGTDSDLTLFNFVKGDRVYSFTDAKTYPESPKSLIQAINMSDIALACVPSTGLTARTGECIVALDLLGGKKGLFVITMSDKSNLNAISELTGKIKTITKSTNLENWETVAVSTTTFEGLETLKEKLFALDEEVKTENASKDGMTPRVMVDHFFNVKGIGCVILGTVTQGTINIHDKLTLFPPRRETEIRSIQSNDVDVKTAGTGARVGLALKGVQAKEFDRGYMISQKEEISSKFNLECQLAKFTDGFAVGDAVHLFAGLQSEPAKIESITVDGKNVTQVKAGSVCNVVLYAQKDIAYNKDDRFLIVQLNYPKQRFVAGCEVRQ